MHSEREDRNVDEEGEGDDGGARDDGGGRVHGAEFGGSPRVWRDCKWHTPVHTSPK